MNLNSMSELWAKLQDKEYRDGYVEGQFDIEVPFQIRALRQARGWTQEDLAKYSGLPESQIAEMEDPNCDPPSVQMLHKLCAAFDVGLLIQFVPFSEMVERESNFHPETFNVASFSEDQFSVANILRDSLRSMRQDLEVISEKETKIIKDAWNEIDLESLCKEIPLKPNTKHIIQGHSTTKDVKIYQVHQFMHEHETQEIETNIVNTDLDYHQLKGLNV